MRQKIDGFIVIHERGGIPILPSFDPSKKVAQALGAETLNRVLGESMSWKDWEKRGYAAAPASLNVERE